MLSYFIMRTKEYIIYYEIAILRTCDNHVSVVRVYNIWAWINIIK